MGDDISLDELMHHGLVTKVVDDEHLYAAAQGWIDHLFELPAQHVLATKQLMNRVEPFQMTLQMRAAEYHVRSQLDVLDDTFEAVNEFAERRPPVFRRPLTRLGRNSSVRPGRGSARRVQTSEHGVCRVGGSRLSEGRVVARRLRCSGIVGRADESPSAGTAHHAQRFAEVVVAIRGGHTTAYEVAREMRWSRSWDRIEGFMRRAAVSEAAAHLAALEQRGIVREIVGEPSVWEVVEDQE